MSLVFETYRPLFAKAPPPDYAWDMWRDTSYFIHADALYADRVAKLSDYAGLGLTIAIVEWCCARLAAFPETAQVLAYTDAVWVAMTDRDRLRDIDLHDEDWQGPVRAPLQICTMILHDAVFDAWEASNYAAPVGWARHLCEYILPADQLGLFREWTETIVIRLEAHHPFEMSYTDIFEEEFYRGEPLGPQAYIAADNYEPEANRASLAQHLADCAKAGNPFLKPAV